MNNDPSVSTDPLAAQITYPDVIKKLQDMCGQKDAQIAQLLTAQEASMAQARKVLAERDETIRMLQCGQNAVDEACAVLADGT